MPSLYLDFWSIWPDKIDIEDAPSRVKRALGQSAPELRKFAKYPLENKLYHLVVMLAGLSAIGTGLFMMKRVRTPFFTRNPYLFSDMTWGWMYVLHGLAGVGFVALVTVHIYFAIRPEKFFITKSMIFGWMSREKYLEHHDPHRWPVTGQPPSAPRRSSGFEKGSGIDGPRRGKRSLQRHRRVLRIHAGLRRAGTFRQGKQPVLRPGTRISERAVKALTGLAEEFAKAVRQENFQPAERYLAFLAVLERDAVDSLATIQLVLAQPTISSQLVDNLNASIHLRALLTDLFLIDEILKPQPLTASPESAS